MGLPLHYALLAFSDDLDTTTVWQRDDAIGFFLIAWLADIVIFEGRMR